MARSLSQTLVKFNSLSFSIPSSSNHVKSAPSRLLAQRNRSNLSRKSSNLIEVEMGSEPETEKIAIQKLEDAIHKIIIKRSQPDWLPFVPGASYWVPPKSKARGFAEVITKLATSVNKDETMSLATTNRGWPSSEYFFKGASPSPLEGETGSKKTSQNEEEEG